MNLDGAVRLAWALAFLAASTGVFASDSEQTNRPRTIVAFFGGEFRTPSNEAISEVLRNEFGSRDGEFELFSEYIDSVRFEGPEHARRLAAFLRDRYSDRKVDLMFAADPPALRFLLRYRDEIAPGVPVVFTNILKSTLQSLRLPRDFLGIADDVDATSTVKLALDLRPDATELVIVTGDDALGRIWESRLREAAAAVAPSIPHRVISRLAIEDIERELGKLTSRAVVLCGSFRRDGAGTVYPGALYVLDRFAVVSGAPIFHVVPAAIGRGAVGSVSVPRQTSAQQAVTIARSILAGTAPEAIPLPVPIVPTAHVDWRQVRRWGIDEALLPTDAVVMFREPSAWNQYRYHILAVSGVIVLQAALIAGLMLQRSRKLRAEAERRRAEAELLNTRAELAHMTRVFTLGELSGSLAHELNQPLAAILSNAQAAQRFIATGGQEDLLEVREILADIVQADKHAGEVIRRMRSMVKKDVIDAAPLDLANAVNEVLLLLHSDAVLRHVHVSLQVDPDLPAVLGNRIQLQQVILNLMLNAFDAMNELHPSQRNAFLKIGREGQKTLKVSVTDVGHGLPENSIGRVFEAFYTTKPTGLGMGLSISRSIVEAHRGRLWAENNRERGATFCFTVPLAAR
jgi:signal transduction histidine kinase